MYSHSHSIILVCATKLMRYLPAGVKTGLGLKASSTPPGCRLCGLLPPRGLPAYPATREPPLHWDLPRTLTAKAVPGRPRNTQPATPDEDVTRHKQRGDKGWPDLTRFLLDLTQAAPRCLCLTLIFLLLLSLSFLAPPRLARCGHRAQPTPRRRCRAKSRQRWREGHEPSKVMI